MTPYYFVRTNNGNLKLDLGKILYIEARRNYTRLVTTEKTLMLNITLREWSAILPPESFCQIHRGYIVSLLQLHAFDNKSVWLPGAQLPIGQQYRDALPGKVMILGGAKPRKVVAEEACL